MLEQTGSDLRTLDDALAAIAAGADARDAAPVPSFPETAIAALADAGAMSWNAVTGTHRPPAAAELDLVRRVARADGSVGRIFDGHLNAVERIAVQGPDAVRESELEGFASGALRGGVWGGDPVPGEGDPATVVTTTGGSVLRGVKTFCSGAGGLHRALVIARDERGGPPLSVWIDLTDERSVEIDETWYRAHGLRASVSHRVVFHDAPVLAQLGGRVRSRPSPGSRATRCGRPPRGPAWPTPPSTPPSATWRRGRAVATWRRWRRGGSSPPSGRLDVWMHAAAEAMDRADETLDQIALHGRAAIYDACRTLLDEAARACGSRPVRHGRGPGSRAP